MRCHGFSMHFVPAIRTQSEMHFRPKIFLLLLLLHLLRLFPANVESLKCFQCRSDKDANCASSPPNSHLRECVAQSAETTSTTTTTSSTTTTESDAETTEESTRRRRKRAAAAFKCRKISQTLYVTDPYETIVFRECATLYGQDECNETSNKLFEQFVCDCSDDACNTSPKTIAITECHMPILLIGTYIMFT